jgi:pantetheine-phosphate adenylyltransferase
MKTGVYAGSFDPITRGHLEVIKQALHVVDQLHVVVAVNTEKKGLFSFSERLALVDAAIGEGLSESDSMRVHSTILTNALTTEYAKLVGANILIRGLRNPADYAYERSQAALNKLLAPEIETIFVPTSAKYEEVSSSTVKGLMKFRGGEVAASEFVTPKVLEALRNKSLF